jgi:beta-1,4-mannosyl-glycoprotein beta-1,4-N-acetylglucosaminyltransferase
MTKIIDCITYFRESFVTKLRLEILRDVVDQFIICESLFDHRSRPKKINFELHDKSLELKVQKITIDHPFPEPGDPWKCQKYQRDYILKYLNDVDNDDYIMFSDPDEIPNPKLLENFNLNKKFGIFMQNHFVYNFKTIDQYQNPWAGTRITKKKFLKSIDDLKHKVLVKNMKKWWRPDKERNIELINDGGWHFKDFFSAEEISIKLKTFAHTEFDNERYTQIEKINELINKKQDVYGRGRLFKNNDNENNLPDYVIKNKENLSNFF